MKIEIKSLVLKALNLQDPTVYYTGTSHNTQELDRSEKIATRITNILYQIHFYHAQDALIFFEQFLKNYPACKKFINTVYR